MFSEFVNALSEVADDTATQLPPIKISSSRRSSRRQSVVSDKSSSSFKFQSEKPAPTKLKPQPHSASTYSMKPAKPKLRPKPAAAYDPHAHDIDLDQVQSFEQQEQMRKAVLQKKKEEEKTKKTLKEKKKAKREKDARKAQPESGGWGFFNFGAAAAPVKKKKPKPKPHAIGESTRQEIDEDWADSMPQPSASSMRKASIGTKSSRRQSLQPSATQEDDGVSVISHTSTLQSHPITARKADARNDFHDDFAAFADPDKGGIWRKPAAALIESDEEPWQRVAPRHTSGFLTAPPPAKPQETSWGGASPGKSPMDLIKEQREQAERAKAEWEEAQQKKKDEEEARKQAAAEEEERKRMEEEQAQDESQNQPDDEEKERILEMHRSFKKLQSMSQDNLGAEQDAIRERVEKEEAARSLKYQQQQEELFQRGQSPKVIPHRNIQKDVSQASASSLEVQSIAGSSIGSASVAAAAVIQPDDDEVPVFKARDHEPKAPAEAFARRWSKQNSSRASLTGSQPSASGQQTPPKHFLLKDNSQEEIQDVDLSKKFPATIKAEKSLDELKQARAKSHSFMHSSGKLQSQPSKNLTPSAPSDDDDELEVLSHASEQDSPYQYSRAGTDPKMSRSNTGVQIQKSAPEEDHPINIAHAVSASVLPAGNIGHPKPKVMRAHIEKGESDPLGLEFKDDGVLIRVAPNSASSRAGLQAGQRIVAINGTDISTLPTPNRFPHLVALVKQSPTIVDITYVDPTQVISSPQHFTRPDPIPSAQLSSEPASNEQSMISSAAHPAGLQNSSSPTEHSSAAHPAGMRSITHSNTTRSDKLEAAIAKAENDLLAKRAAEQAGVKQQAEEESQKVQQQIQDQHEEEQARLAAEAAAKEAEDQRLAQEKKQAEIAEQQRLAQEEHERQRKAQADALAEQQRLQEEEQAKQQAEHDALHAEIDRQEEQIKTQQPVESSDGFLGGFFGGFGGAKDHSPSAADNWHEEAQQQIQTEDERHEAFLKEVAEQEAQEKQAQQIPDVDSAENKGWFANLIGSDNKQAENEQLTTPRSERRDKLSQRKEQRKDMKLQLGVIGFVERQEAVDDNLRKQMGDGVFDEHAKQTELTEARIRLSQMERKRQSVEDHYQADPIPAPLPLDKKFANMTKREQIKAENRYADLKNIIGDKLNMIADDGGVYHEIKSEPDSMGSGRFFAQSVSSQFEFEQMISSSTEQTPQASSAEPSHDAQNDPTPSDHGDNVRDSNIDAKGDRDSAVQQQIGPDGEAIEVPAHYDERSPGAMTVGLASAQDAAENASKEVSKLGAVRLGVEVKDKVVVPTGAAALRAAVGGAKLIGLAKDKTQEFSQEPDGTLEEEEAKEEEKAADQQPDKEPTEPAAPGWMTGITQLAGISKVQGEPAKQEKPKDDKGDDKGLLDQGLDGLGSGLGNLLGDEPKKEEEKPKDSPKPKVPKQSTAGFLGGKKKSPPKDGGKEEIPSKDAKIASFITPPTKKSIKKDQKTTQTFEELSKNNKDEFRHAQDPPPASDAQLEWWHEDEFSHEGLNFLPAVRTFGKTNSGKIERKYQSDSDTPRSDTVKQLSRKDAKKASTQTNRIQTHEESVQTPRTKQRDDGTQTPPKETAKRSSQTPIKNYNDSGVNTPRSVLSNQGSNTPTKKYSDDASQTPRSVTTDKGMQTPRQVQTDVPTQTTSDELGPEIQGPFDGLDRAMRKLEKSIPGIHIGRGTTTKKKLGTIIKDIDRRMDHRFADENALLDEHHGHLQNVYTFLEKCFSKSANSSGFNRCDWFDVHELTAQSIASVETRRIRDIPHSHEELDRQIAEADALVTSQMDEEKRRRQQRRKRLTEHVDSDDSPRDTRGRLASSDLESHVRMADRVWRNQNKRIPSIAHAADIVNARRSIENLAEKGGNAEDLDRVLQRLETSARHVANGDYSSPTSSSEESDSDDDRFARLTQRINSLETRAKSLRNTLAYDQHY